MALQLRNDKRKRNREPTIKDFIVDDPDDFCDSDDSVEISEKNSQKKRKKNSRYYDNKERQLEKLSRDRDIGMEEIFDIELDDDDNVWFYDYINIREECEDEEQRIKMKNKIYDRYNLLKKLKNQGINNAYKSPEEDIMNRIMECHHTKEYKMKLINLIKDKIKNSESEEYHKTIDLINVVLEIPTSVGHSELSVPRIVQNLEDHLDDNMYGMDNVKLKILESMCSILCSKDKNGKILTLVGPPGVGKTAICSVIAQALQMPYEHISLGSISDPLDLCGHASTYIASKPGLFLNILRQSGRLDNLILLDEVDKINEKHNDGSSISSVLIHILDPTQNDKVRDGYCQDFTYDLSKTFFVLSCNDITKVDKVLRDRLEIVYLDGYDKNEKTEIVCRHLIPKIMKRYSLNTKNYVIKKQDIFKIVDILEDDERSGVRNINRMIDSLFCKIILSQNLSEKSKYYKLLGIGKLKNPIRIDTDLIPFLK